MGSSVDGDGPAEFQHPCKDRNNSHWHTLIRCTVGSLILPLVRLYTFSISVHMITLIRIGYRHKSHAIYTPHIPLWLVTMH